MSGTARLFDMDDMIEVVRLLGLTSSIPVPSWQDTDERLAEDILAHGTDPRDVGVAARYGLVCSDAGEDDDDIG